MEMERVILLSDEELIKKYVEDCELRNYVPMTIKRYRNDVRFLSRFLRKKGKTLIEATKEDFKDFIRCMKNERKCKYTRIERIFSSFSSFYDFLEESRLIVKSPIPSIRKRYLRRYKENNHGERKLISIEEMARFINSIGDTRDKAIALLLAKTGIRKGELISIDLEDINWNDMSIILKPKAKRSNRVVFFDEEAAYILRKWIRMRNSIAAKNEKALFVSYKTGKRLRDNGIERAFRYWAARIGLHNPNSDKIEDHFTPHNCRHWLTTWLMRNGMPREYVKELRGDARREAIDIYYHIDREELKKSYLACIPKLGVE